MRLENIDLMMQTTNKTIFKLNCWDASHARSMDIKLCNAEQNVVKSTYPIIRAVEDLKQLQQPALKPAIDKLVKDTVQDMDSHNPGASSFASQTSHLAHHWLY